MSLTGVLETLLGVIVLGALVVINGLFWRSFGVFLPAKTIEYVDYAGGTLWRPSYTPPGKWYLPRS